ncbi:MAG: methionyl-tRNA formyltransferase [Gammaproteobacteria bacterium]|nr:methionyl-tRNA formyltransferase [Gammaproteobacteria bacterium]
MRVAIIGQHQFGKSVLEAFINRGDTVAGVFCAPDKAGAAADPLKTAADESGTPVFQLASLKSEEAGEILRSLAVDLGVMAYVLQFAPAAFTALPTHGTIQYHPSLLPRHRGPSAIQWPIILGETHTGLTVFRPTDGLDEGPVILQKSTPIGPDDTLGEVYFNRLFPMGVAALLEAADLVTGGRGAATPQDHSMASYEGWCRAAEACVYWHNHVDQIYNLIRGCDPSPGAWTRFRGRKLQLFDARKEAARTYSPGAGAVGTIVSIGERGFRVAAHGGHIEIGKVREEGGKKMSAMQFCLQNDLTVGSLFHV